jgi:hypothetical protein
MKGYKYLIEFVWFFDGVSFEESVSVPAENYQEALQKIQAVWGESLEVCYYEREV